MNHDLSWQDIAELRLTFQPPRVAIYPAGADFGPRVQNHLQFIWLIEGDAVWTVDGTAHQAPEGSVLLSRPGMREHFRWDARRRTRHGWVDFSCGGGGPGLPAMERWPLVRLPGPGDVVPALFDHLAWLAQSPGCAVLAEHALRHAFLAFIHDAGAAASAPSAPEHPLLCQSIERMRRGEGGTPAELAQAGGVSVSYLHRIFRAELGVSPMTALRLLRLDRAAHLLTCSNLTVQDIADECGFASQFHFSRCFSAAYGVPPRTFRLRQSAGDHVPPMRLVRYGRLVERLREQPALSVRS